MKLRTARLERFDKLGRHPSFIKSGVSYVRRRNAKLAERCDLGQTVNKVSLVHLPVCQAGDKVPVVAHVTFPGLSA